MPHIIVEYTDNLRPSFPLDELFGKLHDILEAGSVRRANCKSRAVRLLDYRTGGDELEPSFVHVDLAILEGRSAEFKQEVGKKFLSVLSEAFTPASGAADPEFTLEIREMKKDAYFKIPDGTLGSR